MRRKLLLFLCRRIRRRLVFIPSFNVNNKQWLQRHFSLTDYGWKVLRQCEKALHKWAEDECNGRIQWDEEIGEPVLYRKDKWGDYTCKGQPTFNREEHCLDVARKQAQRFGLEVYHQPDPRGCALYVYSKSDLAQSKFPIDQCYSSVATPVC